MRRALESPPPIAENIRQFYDVAKRIGSDYCLVLPEDLLAREKWPNRSNKVWSVTKLVGIRPMYFIEGPVASYSSAGNELCLTPEEVRYSEANILWPRYGKQAIGWSVIFEEAHTRPFKFNSVVWGVTKSSMHEIDPAFLCTCQHAAESIDKLINS